MENVLNHTPHTNYSQYLKNKTITDMKANELRIGNYIQVKGEKYNSQIMWILPREVGLDNSVDEIFISDLEPIPLTEEWLIRFGFEVKSASVTHKYSYNIGFFVLSNGLRSNISYDGYEIKYVHQLQNLYFALTGNELNETIH